MSSNKQLYIYSTAVPVLCSIILFFVFRAQQQKIAMVDAVRLFNEYNMKKDLDKQAGGALQYIGQQADSLAKEIQQQQAANLPVDTALLRLYRQTKALWENEYAESNSAISEMAWKRLNPLVDKFGKEKKMHLIIGANGMGSVLYHDNYYDVTDEVIRFANIDYENAE